MDFLNLRGLMLLSPRHRVLFVAHAIAAHVFFVLPSAAAAQRASVRDVVDAPQCTTCRIERDTRMVFHSSSADGDIEVLPFGIRRHASGTYWVFSEGRPPRVFAADGSFERSVGRSGSGPGEYESAYDAMWLPGDSTLILDDHTRRGTVLRADGTPIRYVRLPTQVFFGQVGRWPIGVIASGAGPHADGTVYPLQVVSFEKDVAAVTRSFGPPTRAFRGITHHVLATGASGVVVSASPLAYQLHLWSSSGAPLQTLVRRPAWFADSSSGRVGTPQTPPAPLIQTLGVDRAGYIWVFIRVAATSWQTSWAAVPAGAREVSSRELDYGRLFDTRVEVIDPARGRVVARETVSGLVSAWLGDGEVAVYGASGSDDAVLRVDKLRLTR